MLGTAEIGSDGRPAGASLTHVMCQVSYSQCSGWGILGTLLFHVLHLGSNIVRSSHVP